MVSERTTINNNKDTRIIVDGGGGGGDDRWPVRQLIWQTGSTQCTVCRGPFLEKGVTLHDDQMIYNGDIGGDEDIDDGEDMVVR